MFLIKYRIKSSKQKKCTQHYAMGIKNQIKLMK